MFQESCTEDFALRTAETVQSSTVSTVSVHKQGIESFSCTFPCPIQRGGAVRPVGQPLGTPSVLVRVSAALKSPCATLRRESEGAGSIWKYHVPKTLGDVIRKTWKF